MKLMTLVAVLAVLGAGGYFGFVQVSKIQYGTSSEDPLGSFEKLDIRLTDEARLTKAQVSRLGIRNISETAEMYEYVNPENEYERIVLLLDPDKRVSGMVGSYYLTDFGSRSPVASFARGHWRRSGGAKEPEFSPPVSTPVPTGMSGPFPKTLGNIKISEAKFTTDRVEGTWTRSEWESQYSETIYLRTK